MEAMRKTLAKVLGAAVLAGVGLSLPAAAWADTEVQSSNSTSDSSVETGNASAQNSHSGFTGQAAGQGGSNEQHGDNTSKGDQDAAASSGHGVGGQVIGVADGDGNVKVIASNDVTSVAVSTGNANALNADGIFVGQFAGNGGVNVQHGDNEAKHSQTASANTGDGVAGQVIGIA